ncbi:hypothetical protein [Kitasatospora sp. MAP5-34]|uniref:hypothetical protein n=1 Tax=Kitasatospora sp. MAP5-34 TaxID=3035102 RepID=UPI0024752CDD|nr:hypothetical protein [Kitasatospora sp. MAP5-34]MDH6576197.1 hypothetical protein [Kitasatospora sp. MAP5-34]
MLVEIHLNQHILLSGMVGQVQPELLVQLGAVGSFGISEDGDKVAVGPNAAARNLIRLHTWWNGMPLDRANATSTESNSASQHRS